MNRGAFTALIFALASAGGGWADCTVGVVGGEATADGRPVLWKNRDNRPVIQQRLSYYPATTPGTFAYIGVHTAGGGPAMGLNEAGLAAGHSRGDEKGKYVRNGIAPTLLANYSTTDEVQAYIDRQINLPSGDPKTLWLSGCFPFIDARGRAVVFEGSKSRDPAIGIWYRTYDAANPARRAQNLFGIVPRANTFHRIDDGTDNLAFDDHYATCRINLQGLRDLGILDASTIVQGSPSREFEVLRYSRHSTPGRYDNIRDISRWWTLSAAVVQGVRAGEDPALTTMWTVLGKADYCIAVPAWARVANIPDVLAEGHMWDRAESLFRKGREAITQASVLPAEAHLFTTVNTILLPHWRTHGAPPAAEMERVEHRMANDAYSLLHCLDTAREDNQAPTIGPIRTTAGPTGRTVRFSADARDPDGRIIGRDWRFGDGGSSSDEEPQHTFTGPGRYLVSCTVKDNEEVSTTGWAYVTVDADGG